MGLGKPELSCEEKRCEAYDKACECFARLIESDAQGDIKHFVEMFFKPEFAIDPDQLNYQNLLYLSQRQPCGVAVGNNAEKKCLRQGCGNGCDCGCPVYEEVATGCDDPTQCDSYSVGWNYAAIARAAEHAVSVPYIPYRIRNLRPGDSLIWDPRAIPDNKHCNPCLRDQYGAFVNKPASMAETDRIKAIIRQMVDKDYISETIQEDHNEQ